MAARPGPVVLHVERLRAALGGRLLFDGLDLALRAGEAVAILGPQGSGKSALTRILTGQIPADAGRISAAGPVPPPAGLGVGFGATASVERDLALRCAAYGASTAALLREIARALPDPSALERPFPRLDASARAIVTHLATYLIPAALYIADNGPFPMQAGARERVEPLFRALRRRSGILWVSGTAGALRDLEPDRILSLEAGRLRALDDIEEAEDLFLPPRAREARRAAARRKADQERRLAERERMARERRLGEQAPEQGPDD